MKSVVKKVCVFSCVFACCTALKGDDRAFAGNQTGTNNVSHKDPVSHLVRQQSFTPINLSRYLEEVSLTESGLTNFFKCYNNPFYSRRFLPSCFLHVTDFLKFLPGQTDPWSYVTTIFSMFLTKMKGCSWTNAFALADLLEALPAYLEPLTYVEHFRQSFKDELRQKIVMFTVKDPNECVEILMTDFDRYHDMLHKVSEFQSETVRFLDAALDRLIWDPADKKMVWESFKRIGKALEVLTDKQIISKDNSSEVIRSLLSSFAKFIDICGASMSAEWYKHALSDVETLTFLRSEEVDPLMETKTVSLTKCLKLGYAQVLMYQKNLVVPQ